MPLDATGTEPTTTDTPVLASSLELARKTGRTPSDEDVIDALRQASNRFVGAVGHPVALVEGDTIELDGNGGQAINLPAVPVESVTSVLIDGTALEPAAYRATKRTGILRRRDGGVWPRGAAIEVTYAHGYPLDRIPADIQSAVLEKAEIILNIIVGIQQRSVLGDSVAFGTVAAVGSTEAWSQAVANYSINDGDEA